MMTERDYFQNLGIIIRKKGMYHSLSIFIYDNDSFSTGHTTKNSFFFIRRKTITSFVTDAFVLHVIQSGPVVSFSYDTEETDFFFGANPKFLIFFLLKTFGKFTYIR